MLAWMRAFGQLKRVGAECTGTYGAGLLRYMQNAGIEVLDVTTPDKSDRRKRGKDDDLDAHNTIVCAPDEPRDVLRNMKRMQLIRTLAACGPICRTTERWRRRTGSR